MRPTTYPAHRVIATDLACRRGGRLIFTGVSFILGGGDALAVTGPNGSGKSSLLRIVGGLLRPDAGHVSMSGGESLEGSVHYLGHAESLKPSLTLRETLRFWGTLYGKGHAATEGDIERCAGDVALTHALDLPVGVLSAGQRRRAALARIILSPRPLWVLDEPTSSLDRDGEDMLGVLMRAHLSAGGSIIAATHQALPLEVTRTFDLGSP